MGADVGVAESVDMRYERAYGQFATDVFRFALAWTNDWAAAEDLTQEAYLRLWNHRASIDWERPILGWLLVTTRRLANNRFRSINRFRSLHPRLTALDSARQADESVSARWLDVRHALESLTSLERAALIMTAVEGWSYAEVADVLQTTDGALRTAVSRARQKLEVA